MNDFRRSTVRLIRHRARVSGVIMNAPLSPQPSASVQALAPEVLQHWGLIASPFASEPTLAQPLQPTEFYFRSSAHASAWGWLQNVVRRSASLSVVTNAGGAGATTWVRQLMASSGLGDIALEIAATSWQNQSLDQLTMPLTQTAGNFETPSCVRNLWIIQATGKNSSDLRQVPGRLALMAGWRAARSKRYRNLNIVLVMRKSEYAMTSLPVIGAGVIDRHHLSRTGNHELRRCVNTALHHAGAIRPAFTVSAVSHLADACGGSIRRLGTLVHTALVHGHLAGVRQITQSDLTRQFVCEREGATPRDQSRAA